MKGEDGFKFASQLTVRYGDIWLSELAQYNHKNGRGWAAEKKKNPEWEQYEHSVSESNAPGAEKCKGMFPLGLQKEIYSVHILIFNLMRSISDVYTP